MILEWIASSCLLILAVLGLRAALGRRISPSLHYALWAVVLFRLLVPVQLFTSPLAGITVAPPPEVLQTKSIYVLPLQSVPVDEAPLVTAGEERLVLDANSFGYARVEDEGATVRRYVARISPLEALGWLWIAGAAVLGAVLLISNLSFSAKLRRVRRPLEGTGAPIPVYLAEGLPSPCLFGLFRTAIYITPQAAADPNMLRHVLAHELTHYRHLDHLWSALRGVALAVHWWNPLAWLAAVYSRRDGELACDDGALRQLGDGARIAYGETLLALVTAKTGPRDLLCCATTMTGEKRSLQKRILQISRKPKILVSATIAVILLLTAFSACAFGRKAEVGDFSWTSEELEATADLNRDGKSETFRLSRSAEDGPEQWKLEVVQNKKVLWSSTMDETHSGCNTYFLYREDGLDYLFEYTPNMQQGNCTYSYRMFHLSGKKEVVDREKEIEFSTYATGNFSPKDIAGFMNEVNGLIGESTLLVNTNHWGLYLSERADGTLYDDILGMFGFFMDQVGYGVDEDEDLEKVLMLYQSYMNNSLGDAFAVSNLVDLLSRLKAEQIGDISTQNRVTAEELTALLIEASKHRVLSRQCVSRIHGTFAEIDTWAWSEAEWAVPLAGGGILHLVATTAPGEVAIAAEASTGIEMAFYRSEELHALILDLGTDLYPADVLPDTPDLNHDGKPDKLVLRSGSASGRSGYVIQCLMETDSGKQVWTSESTSRNALFLCQVDGEDYLLRYIPAVGDLSCSYGYRLFYLDDSGETVTARQNDLYFVFDPDEPATRGRRFDPRKIANYMDNGINALLAQSTLLVNTDPDLAETFQREGRLYDSLSWLNDTREEERSLLENLTIFWNDALAKAAVPTLYEVFSQIETSDILTPSGTTMSPSTLANVLRNSASSQNLDVRTAEDFPEEAAYQMETTYLREGDTGEQRMKLEASDLENVVRVTLSGQATAVMESENPDVPGRYLRDTPYEYTCYVRNEVLYNCLIWYTED